MAQTGGCLVNTTLMSDLASEITAILVVGGFILLTFKRGKAMLTRFKNLLSIPSKVDSIFKELKPNGGSSVHDKIDQIQAQVKQSAHRTRVLWGIQAVGFFECGPDGGCVYANPALCELFGLSETKMLGRGWLTAVADEDERARVWKDWQQAVGNDYPYDARYRIVHQQTGVESEVHAVAYILRDDAGNPTWFFGTVK